LYYSVHLISCLGLKLLKSRNPDFFSFSSFYNSIRRGTLRMFVKFDAVVLWINHSACPAEGCSFSYKMDFVFLYVDCNWKGFKEDIRTVLPEVYLDYWNLKLLWNTLILTFSVFVLLFPWMFSQNDWETIFCHFFPV
jgi:hypothetical protein